TTTLTVPQPNINISTSILPSTTQTSSVTTTNSTTYHNNIPRPTRAKNDPKNPPLLL
ncbi:10042_t:CDS:2, partial [Dentiscutata heterogama]